MEKNSIIKGAEIQNLITKFYYKNNHLCFQILLYLGVENTVPFKEFTDYTEYKKVYSELMDAKTNNQVVSIPQNNLVLTNMGLA